MVKPTRQKKGKQTNLHQKITSTHTNHLSRMWKRTNNRQRTNLLPMLRTGHPRQHTIPSRISFQISAWSSTGIKKNNNNNFTYKKMDSIKAFLYKKNISVKKSFYHFDFNLQKKWEKPPLYYLFFYPTLQ